MFNVLYDLIIIKPQCFNSEAQHEIIPIFVIILSFFMYIPIYLNS